MGIEFIGEKDAYREVGMCAPICLFMCVCDDCGHQSDMIEIPSNAAVGATMTAMRPRLEATGWKIDGRNAKCSVCGGK